jgi:hypothetical protein
VVKGELAVVAAKDPSTYNSTLTTARLSIAFTKTVTPAEILEPFAGDTMLTVGGVVSEELSTIIKTDTPA